jgi:hypothetical protein
MDLGVVFMPCEMLRVGLRVEASQSNISKVFLMIIACDEVMKHHQKLTSMWSSQNVFKRNYFENSSQLT